MLNMNLRLSLLLLVVGVSISNAALLQPRIGIENNLNAVGKSARSSATSLLPPEINEEIIWKTVKEYLFAKNIRGLWIYLSYLPETRLALDWLEENHPDVFHAVCWIFDACDNHDITIPPEVIQKILQYIYRNDWEGLVNYLKTLEYYEYLLEWIKDNFPQAWSEICKLIDPTKC